MIADSKARCREGSVREQIGKVYLVVSAEGVLLRKCLICECVFTREEAREHFGVRCYPSSKPILAIGTWR